MTESVAGWADDCCGSESAKGALIEVGRIVPLLPLLGIAMICCVLSFDKPLLCEAHWSFVD